MTASDIPTYWSSSTAMAKALATYMADPHAIRRAVLDTFQSAPEIHTIRGFQAAHRRKKPRAEPFKAHEGYYPGDASAALIEVNKTFLWRLDQERLLSQRRKEAA